ncbi:MAG: hypothetical protein ABL901_03185 [Hyphomicrobiaceae bacterium]
MTTTQHPTNAAIITANMMAIRYRLFRALEAVRFSCKAMKAENQDLAIGFILDVERQLPECEALYRTIVMLHRSRNSIEQNEVRS